MPAGSRNAGTYQAKDADSAYRWLIQQCLSHGATVPSVKDASSVGSCFGEKGRPFLEVFPLSFGLSNPLARWVWHGHRAFSITNAIGLWWWSISGSDRLDHISFYNPHAILFSDDQQGFAGALGPRLVELLPLAISRLESDPTSRRAFVPLFWPEDLRTASRNTPCLSELQLLIRDGRLNLFATFRSNDLLDVFPYDLFLSTMIQELAARLLGLEPGFYFHSIHSAHVYVESLAAVKSIAEPCRSASPPMPPMPRETSESLLAELVGIEKAIRTRPFACGWDADLSSIPNYWANLLRIACVRRAVLDGDGDSIHYSMTQLDEPFRSMASQDKRLQLSSQADPD